MLTTAEAHDRRDRAVLLGAAALLVALAWAGLLRGHAPASGIAAPHVHAGGFDGLLLAWSMWMVMMVGMMLPAVLPWILLFAAANRARAAGSPPYASVALFTGGYFAIWTAYALAAAGAQIFLQRQGALYGSDLRVGPVLGGALLVAAGAFQWTSLKAACLEHCRTPLSFFFARWRDGPSGAFRMGFAHGSYCLGCCWALMALSFALGVMNLAWMAVLTLVVCAEKIAPRGRALGRVCGVLLAIWGLRLMAG